MKIYLSNLQLVNSDFKSQARYLCCMVICVTLALLLMLASCSSSRGNKTGDPGKAGSESPSDTVKTPLKPSEGDKGREYSSVTSATPYGGYEYKQVEQELHTINLVNSLFLSKDQMKRLLPLVKEMNEINLDLSSLMQKNYPYIIVVMKDMKKRLMTHTAITEEQQKELDKYAVPIYEKMAEKRDKTKVLLQKAKGILNPNQIQIIASYEPCIVPDGRVTDPQRIGGVGGDESFGELLDEIRDMPEDEYKKLKKEYLDRKEKLMKVYNTERQIRVLINQLDDSMEKARKMNDMDFELHKSELMNISMPRAQKPQNVNLVDEAVGKFLLNPVMMEYIENKLKD